MGRAQRDIDEQWRVYEHMAEPWPEPAVTEESR